MYKGQLICRWTFLLISAQHLLCLLDFFSRLNPQWFSAIQNLQGLSYYHIQHNEFNSVLKLLFAEFFELIWYLGLILVKFNSSWKCKFPIIWRQLSKVNENDQWDTILWVLEQSWEGYNSRVLSGKATNKSLFRGLCLSAEDDIRSPRTWN